MGDIQTLVEMGFPKEKAEYAMKITQYKGVEPAMEWLLAHGNDVDPSADENAVSTQGEEAATNDDAANSTDPLTPGGVAKGLKCDDCGRIFTENSDVEYHALKTGHEHFSESTEEKKPLSEEERKNQLQIIEDKLKQKRLERQEREKADALEREKNRIKSGKDMAEARRRLEEIEMKKIVEQRKKEKAEEKAARDRVKAQIEADKAARKAKEQNQVDEPPVTNAQPSASATITSPSSTKTPTKDYTKTRIQIRLQDGSTITETFNVKEQLSAVRVFIQMKTGTETSFGLMTSFPRKIFNDDDYEKPLEVLGLVPSAVVIMTKAQA